MSIEATADALAADKAVPPVDVPQGDFNDDAELGAIFDKADEKEANAEQPTEIEEVAEVEAVEEPEDEPEKAPEVEIPGNLPEELRKHWATLSDDARQAVLTDRDGLHRKLSDMGRQVQGISPIRDALVEATKELPHMANMRPVDVAKEVFSLARISQDFAQRPVETLMGLAKKHGLEQALSQHFQGQPVTQGAQENAALKQHIAQLERQVQQFGNPDYIRDQVSQITGEERVMGDVQQFADTAEHWADVEGHIPLFIEAAKAKNGEGAAHRAVLETAYNMAIETFKPQALKAPPESVADPTFAADPEKTKAALKAKSVNVSGKATGKPRVMTEDEELSAAFDRANKR